MVYTNLFGTGEIKVCKVGKLNCAELSSMVANGKLTGAYAENFDLARNKTNSTKGLPAIMN